MGKIEYELLSSSDAPQVGVLRVMLPASVVGVVRQRRLVAVRVKPPWKTPLGNSGAIGVGQDSLPVEPWKHSSSLGFAPVVVAVLREVVRMVACPGEVVSADPRQRSPWRWDVPLPSAEKG